MGQRGSGGSGAVSRYCNGVRPPPGGGGGGGRYAGGGPTEHFIPASTAWAKAWDSSSSSAYG